MAIKTSSSDEYDCSYILEHAFKKHFIKVEVVFSDFFFDLN